MDTKTTVQSLMDSIQKGDFEKARSFLSSDFKFSGPVPEPINADAWLGMSISLKKAFPNLEYQFHTEATEDDVVKISAQLKGTNNGDFDLTGMNMGIIPATKKSFSAAREHGKVTVKGDKVTSWANEPTEGAGLMAILGQLGVKTPAM
jgi:predicted ester cyclase